MEPVLGIVSVGYGAVGGGLGGTVAVCVVGVHLRPEHLRGGQEFVQKNKIILFLFCVLNLLHIIDLILKYPPSTSQESLVFKNSQYNETPNMETRYIIGKKRNVSFLAFIPNAIIHTREKTR